MKLVEYEGIEFQIGENANDNWDILKKSKQNWIWFHLDNFPSPYVILTEPIKSLKKNSNFRDLINHGCLLCKENSKYSNQKVKVIWTTCKNVSFGNTPGEAIISGKLNNYTI
jgi:predicted ribosome quality control (RQC) complex YloA/Tae2 family protein